jgi:hypothetical protein
MPASAVDRTRPGTTRSAARLRRRKLPEVRDHLDTARADILAVTEFPE